MSAADLKALKLWLANPGSNESWNADDVDMCRRALAAIEALETQVTDLKLARGLADTLRPIKPLQGFDHD
jgi:hypothetical protein